MNFRPQYVIPFKQSKDDALNAYEKFLKKKAPYVARKFAPINAGDFLKQVYIPVYIVSAKAKGKVKFETTRIREDKPVDYSLYREGEAEIKDMVFSVSSIVPDEMLSCLGSYNFKEAEKYSKQLTSYTLVEDSKDDEKETYELIDEAIKQKVEESFLNEIKEKESIYLDESEIEIVEKEVKRFFLPVWVMKIQYKKAIYTIIIDGQNGHVTGDLPADMRKYYREIAWISILASAIIFLGVFYTGIASAAETTETLDVIRVIDNADLLTDKQEANLEYWSDGLSEKYGVDLIILIEDKITGNIELYGEKFLKNSDYGLGDTKDACLFVYNGSKNTMTVITQGYATEAINAYGKEYLGTELQNASEDGVNSICSEFLDTSDFLLKRAAKGKPFGKDDTKTYWEEFQFDIGFSLSKWVGLGCSIAIGIVIGLIVAYKQRNKLIKLYVRDESFKYDPVVYFKITSSRDVKKK